MYKRQGGYYNNGNKDKLAGSYGCFGFIPKNQMGSKSEMEKWRKNESYKKEKISNEPYKKFINDVVKLRGNGELRILIKKRTNVENFRILKNQ